MVCKKSIHIVGSILVGELLGSIYSGATMDRYEKISRGYIREQEKLGVR